MKKKEKTEQKAPEEAPEHDPAAEVMAAVADAVGEDSTAMIYLSRQDQERQWKHLRRFAPRDFDVDEVRELYGGGEYRVRIKNAAGKFMGGVRRFGIEGDPYTPTRDELRDRSGDDKPNRDDRIFELLLAMVARPSPAPPAAPDPVGMAAAMAEASARGMSQLAEIVGLRNEMERSRSDGPDSFERMMDVFQMGMKFGRESSEDGGGFGAVASALTPLIERLSQGAPPTNTVPAGPDAPQPVPTRDPMVAAFEILLPPAESGSQYPESWAAIALENVPGLLDSLEANIRTAGGLDAFLLHLGRIEPRIQAHEPFFRAAVGWLLDEPQETDNGSPSNDEERDNEED